MDKTTLAFFCLVLVLFVGQVFINEQFTDISGSIVSLSLADLLSLIGRNHVQAPVLRPAPVPRPTLAPQFDESSYNSFKATMLSDVKQVVRDELLNGSLSTQGDTVLSDDCIDSFSAQQGSDFMKYVPGKNPADYIRKDSVPCFGCSVP